ncbi:CaiF/GrlA family transcriptional regulator [Enterobacter ludwigii]
MNKLSRCEIKVLTVPVGNNGCDQKDTARSSKNTRRHISGRQRNHGDFYLPDVICHLDAPSFYMAVAWWGLLSGRSFSRDDVARAFRVSARRAADVMTYLATGVPRAVVGLEKEVLRVGSGRSVLLMTILHVNEQAPPVSGGQRHGHRAPHPPGSARGPRPRGAAADGLKAARDLFLYYRRPPTADS